MNLYNLLLLLLSLPPETFRFKNMCLYSFVVVKDEERDQKCGLGILFHKNCIFQDKKEEEEGFLNIFFYLLVYYNTFFCYFPFLTFLA